MGGWPLNAAAGVEETPFIAKLNPRPPLKIAATVGAATLSWPVRATNYVLEVATSLSAISWNAVTNIPTIGATERSVQLPFTGNAKFFRLRKP